MEQYISKSAVLAEIDKLYQQHSSKEYIDEAGCVLDKLEDIINTLEVKEVDLEKDIRQIISLYYEGIKYYDDVIRREREENRGSDLAIKIMDGVVDARELGIQYVIDKLKAQKGE